MRQARVRPFFALLSIKNLDGDGNTQFNTVAMMKVDDVVREVGMACSNKYDQNTEITFTHRGC